MPRYFFNVFNDETSLDDEGQELPNLQAARAQAIKAARSLMGDTLKKGRLVLSHHIAVQGKGGEVLFDVTFGEAVEIRP